MATKNGMRIIEAGDVINGRMGAIFMKMDGRNIEMGKMKAITAKMGKKKSEIPRLGTTASMNRATGWSGTGEGTIYYGSPVFLEMARQFHQQGKDIYVDILVTNDDPTSNRGVQQLLLKAVNFDDIILALLDIDSDDPLEAELNFTFDDFEVLSTFNQD